MMRKRTENQRREDANEDLDPEEQRGRVES